MRDLDVIERFVAIAHKLGARPTPKASGIDRPAAIVQRRPRKQHNPNHSDIYRWVTTGHTAERLYLGLRDHLGQRRRATADAIIERAHARREELRVSRLCEECGEPFTLNDYGHGKRFCSKACYYEHRKRLPWYREAANRRNRAYKARLRAKRQTEPAPSRPAPASED